MRFKTLAIVGIILLGTVTLSVYSSYNKESAQTDGDIFQKIEVNNSSFLEVQEDWDGFEIIIVDIDKLRKAADDGNLTLNVMGENFEVEIKEKSRLEGENAYFYTGPILGSKDKDSRADLYVGEESLGGSVEPGEPWNVTYNIAPTDKRYNGKIVHVVFMQDWEKQRERLEQAGIDPLQFFLINNDSRKHVMSIEIFDFNNKSVFKENYTINPGDEISSPKIDAELGKYRYEIILDNELTYEAKVHAGFASNLGGSEKLHLTIRDDPDNPIQFVGEIS
ncbi:hypothetical protein MSHOH_2895 [Methanosarcina horonobensis HB-1 = JCM 15518]|uniref:Uncharacterized protein n=1 Tax=Methanosarcina horonobensis HB-1 = JCM 15518 TaxID=1434110 RepID=A0A0E3SHR1_9EURY|nr:hypothetical protein [Methanosarcina horonobensis]AKB79378.1 hypothetical protein MSHOH_2895 [Methanosarcina horonobensis HB-1 = JCM 15518]